MKPMSPTAAHGRLKAIAIKPSHRGLLHEKLGVPKGQPIPMAAKLRAAHSQNKTLAREGQFAVNFSKARGT